jgi:hypothetical protein
MISCETPLGPCDDVVRLNQCRRKEKKMPSLKDKTVPIIGRGSGIARAIALAVSEEGGQVIAAGRQHLV